MLFNFMIFSLHVLEFSIKDFAVISTESKGFLFLLLFHVIFENCWKEKGWFHDKNFCISELGVDLCKSGHFFVCRKCQDSNHKFHKINFEIAVSMLFRLFPLANQEFNIFFS